jgi:hypothetical protein
VGCAVGQTCRAELQGGDDWLTPTAAAALDRLGVQVNGGSNRNGGEFASQIGHQAGRDVDVALPSYAALDASAASYLAQLLFDSNYGFGRGIAKVLVSASASPAFWSVLGGVTMPDGRPATEVVSRWPGKDQNFELVFGK